jgi:hypothetical protein
MASMVAKIVGTIIVSVAWFSFIVLYLAFFAEALNIWQKAAVFLVSGAIAAGIVTVLWIKWAFKLGENQ